MPRLVLGPLLRHIGETDATVWVETDEACEVEVLGHRTRTFAVAGHHYALVVVEGLAPGTRSEYGVALDGVPAWPEPGSRFPPSAVSTLGGPGSLRILFGSCRVSFPHERPYTLRPDEDPRGHGLDALYVYALRMLERRAEDWPRGLFLIGDQVYADEASPATLDFIRARRDVSQPPYEEVADFEEYTRLYHESWQDPVIRWLLSTVSSAMLFDDHDVRDDWNISNYWIERMRATPWWDERVVGAFMSYWIYQHLGNLSPAELREDAVYARVRAAEDGSPVLREYAFEADRDVDGKRWSFHRDFGATRVLAIDCRAGRVLEEGRRLMVDDDEWRWIREHATGGVDHLFLAMSDPFLLAPGISDLQMWNEAVCAGAWGERAARIGEKIREAADLDHWASFPRAFARLEGLLAEVGSGKRGEAPATIVALGGDVHNAYLAEVAFQRGSGVTSRVYQAVCSPIRNPLPRSERWAQQFGASRAAALVGRALRRSAQVPAPRIRWRFLHGPSFENQIATLALTGRQARLTVEAPVERDGAPELQTVFAHELA